jgi:hypothetical protein
LIRVARICGRIGGDEAIAVLRARFEYLEPQVRLHVLAALGQCGYWAAGSPSEAALVQKQIRAEAAQAAGLLAALADLGAAESLRSLAGALRYQLDQARRRLILLLSFVYDPRAVLQASNNLAAPSEHKRAYALEVLDLLLPAEVKSVVFPVLEDLAAEESLGRLAAAFPQIRLGSQARLQAIVADPEAYAPWVRACAVAALARDLDGEARAVLASALQAADPLVRETAAWALRRDASANGQAEGEGRMLSTLEKVLILKTVSLFAQTPDEVLADVASLLEEQEFKAGEPIFTKGETGRCLYIVIDGRVRVHDGERTLNHLGEGAIFGEMAVLDDSPRSASVTADEDTRLFRLDQDPLYELMADRIDVARGIIQVLTANLRARAKDVDDLHSRLERLEGAGK